MKFLINVIVVAVMALVAGIGYQDLSGAQYFLALFVPFMVLFRLVMAKGQGVSEVIVWLSIAATAAAHVLVAFGVAWFTIEKLDFSIEQYGLAYMLVLMVNSVISSK